MANYRCRMFKSDGQKMEAEHEYSSPNSYKLIPPRSPQKRRVSRGDIQLGPGPARPCQRFQIVDICCTSFAMIIHILILFNDIDSKNIISARGQTIETSLWQSIIGVLSLTRTLMTKEAQRSDQESSYSAANCWTFKTAGRPDEQSQLCRGMS